VQVGGVGNIDVCAMMCASNVGNIDVCNVGNTDTVHLGGRLCALRRECTNSLSFAKETYKRDAILQKRLTNLARFRVLLQNSIKSNLIKYNQIKSNSARC